MAGKNPSYNESKILRLLKDNSRLSISEISESLNLSRNTVSKIIKYLNKNYIKKYTIETMEKYDSFYIISVVDSVDDINSDVILEYYELMNGKYLIVLNKNSLDNIVKYDELHIARKRVTNFNNEDIDLYCDYCNNKILGNPRIYELNKNKYYFCCDTCKKTFIKKQKAQNNE